MKYSSVAITVLTALLLQSCGGDLPKESQKSAETTQQTEEDAPSTSLEIEAGDDMKYNLNRLIIPAGQEVTLSLKHIGKIDKNIMGHNLVILQSGADVKAYGDAAVNAKDEDYIPSKLADQVIAHTKMIGGGETTEVKFKIDTPGEYPFLCSFPGHYGMMKGVIIVK